jgi:hypothetical protein
MGIIGSRTREKREMTLDGQLRDSSQRNGKSSKTTCVLDDQVLNRYTIHHMTNLGLSIFADVCGRNRGVFVVDSEPSSTYSCLTLPPSFADGLPESVPMATSNDIGTLFAKNKREYVQCVLSLSN